MRAVRTLRGRLALLALAVTAGWLVLLTVGFNLLVSERLTAQSTGVLRTRAAAVAATVVIDPGGAVSVRGPADDAALDTGVWIYQGHTLVEGPLAPRPVQEAAGSLADRGEVFGATDGAGAARLYALPLPVEGPQEATVVVATAIGPYQRSREVALLGSVVLGVLLLAGSFAINRILLGRALRPMTEMTGQAAEWSAHDVGHRFGPAARPAELEALAATLDGVLDRISAVLRHEQQLTAEISHELRTPLAHIVAEVDLLRARPPTGTETQTETETDRAAASIAASAQRMSAILETLLAGARAGTHTAPGSCAVDDVVTAVLAERRLPGHLRIRRGGLDGVRVGTDAAVTARILGPVLDNAARYADGVVTIHGGVAIDGVCIIVGNDGPPVPPSLTDRIFEPGFRAEAADGHDGAGLGLALSRRLARAAGGDVTLDPATTGAAFVVCLPGA